MLALEGNGKPQECFAQSDAYRWKVYTLAGWEQAPLVPHLLKIIFYQREEEATQKIEFLQPLTVDPC